MTDSTEPMDPSDASEFANDPHAATIARDLVAAFAVAIPEIRLASLAAKRPVRKRGMIRRWRPLALTGTVAAAVVAAIIVSATWGGETTDVSAQTILDKTNQAAATLNAGGGISYHVIATVESPQKVSSQGTNETWAGVPGLFRAEQHNGDGSTFIQVSDGKDVWLAITLPTGETRAVRAPAGPGWNTWALMPGDPKSGDLASTATIADVLASYTVAGCVDAKQQGRATIAGREAYVISVQPTPATCRPGPAVDEKSKRANSARSNGPATVWVDTRTFFTLKTEQFDPSGALQYRYAVSLLAVGTVFSDSTFTYQPPVGASVSIASTIEEAKRALAGLKGVGVESKPAATDGSDNKPAAPGDQRRPSSGETKTPAN